MNKKFQWWKINVQNLFNNEKPSLTKIINTLNCTKSEIASEPKQIYQNFSGIRIRDEIFRQLVCGALIIRVNSTRFKYFHKK